MLAEGCQIFLDVKVAVPLSFIELQLYELTAECLGVFGFSAALRWHGHAKKPNLAHT